MNSPLLLPIRTQTHPEAPVESTIVPHGCAEGIGSALIQSRERCRISCHFGIALLAVRHGGINIHCMKCLHIQDILCICSHLHNDIMNFCLLLPYSILLCSHVWKLLFNSIILSKSRWHHIHSKVFVYYWRHENMNIFITCVSSYKCEAKILCCIHNRDYLLKLLSGLETLPYFCSLNIRS